MVYKSDNPPSMIGNHREYFQQELIKIATNGLIFE